MHQQDIFWFLIESLYIPCGLLKSPFDYCKFLLLIWIQVDSTKNPGESTRSPQESTRTLWSPHGHPLEYIFNLPWARQTHSRVHINSGELMDTLWSTIFNYSKLIQHPPEFNIQLQSAHPTPSRVQYLTYHELNGHTLEFNIQLQWAHWTSSGFNIRLLYTNLY